MQFQKISPWAGQNNIIEATRFSNYFERTVDFAVPLCVLEMTLVTLIHVSQTKVDSSMHLLLALRKVNEKVQLQKVL